MSDSTLTAGAWPGGAPFALCLTHDVDRVAKSWFHYLYYAWRDGVAGQLRSLASRWAGRDPFWNLDALMEFEGALGVRSTVLFLHETARGVGPKYWGRYDPGQPKVARMIRALDAGGWEIGLHGSYFSYANAALLASEKARLEDILGKPVVSTRQHYLNLDGERTFEHQAALGLLVDSSVGYADRVWDGARGWRPYRVAADRLWQLPITVMDTIGVEQAAVREAIQQAVEAVAAAGGVVVLDWHQCAFNAREQAPRVTLYEQLIRWARQRGAWVATMGQIARHLQARQH
jgi:hypothetical protein